MPTPDQSEPRKHCPHCGADLEIVVGLDPGTTRPEPVVGVEIPEVFDGVLYWMCANCRGAWHTWPPEAGRRFEAAKWHVGLANMNAAVSS